VAGEISGSIDANTLPDFRREMQGFLDKGRKHIVLDSSGLKYVNSSGLGAIIKIATELKQEGGGLILVAVPDKILALFKMLGILDVVQVYADTDTALKRLEKAPPEKAPPKREFPLLIRCITCRRKIELPAAGYYRCPRCGACFSVKPEGSVKGYQIDQPQSMELRIPCLPESAALVREASHSLARSKDLPAVEWERVKNLLDQVCTLAWAGSISDERCAVYLVADRKEFRAALRVEHKAFEAEKGLKEIRPLADEMDIVSLPSGAQILKFSRKIRRDGAPS